MKLAQGEYVALENIESIYGGSALVAQLYVHGDSLQSYLIGVAVPDPVQFATLISRIRGKPVSPEDVAALGEAITAKMAFYPTGDQSRDLIETAGLTLKSISQLPATESLDVCFDGADEVDEDLNLIKGGGACLFQEKLVATAAKKFVVVAGRSATDFLVL